MCKSPKLNGACLRLARIAAERNDDAEQALAGKAISEIPEEQWPVCVLERGTFMAPFEYTRHHNHPYKVTSSKTHGHFTLTPLRHPPYSAEAVPFNWLFASRMPELGAEYRIAVDPDREPDLGFKTDWVQDRENHLALLECFFGHIKPEESLVFFYAKKVPFVEDIGRVLVGVGRVTHVGPPIEYEYESKKPGMLRSLLWERIIQHSIRPDFRDGFLLPYHAALEHAAENPDFNPTDVAAMAPGDRWDEFSYASEHVSHDGAIQSLLSCASALQRAKECLAGPWDKCLKWIDARLGKVWKMRGPCPGLGAALCAFGLEYGTFVAREIETKLGQNEAPWPLMDQVFKDPKAHLSPHGARQIGKTMSETWRTLKKERRALLQLLSRFEISPEQAKLVYVEEEREEAGIACSDRDILANPYLIFELTRMTADPVSVSTTDRGVFPDEIIRAEHPLPEPSALDAGTDARRVRALTVHVLQEAASSGSALLPRKEVILRIRNLPLQPACEVNRDLMEVAAAGFEPVLKLTEMDDGSTAYQMEHLAKMGDLIRRVVDRRMKGQPLRVKRNWRTLLDQHLASRGQTLSPGDETEERARQEKTAVLEKLAEGRFSVVIGPAGTGKTTLLSVLCRQNEISAGGILLLAPTGKARVRMEQATEELGLRGFTLAQFLGPHRYDYQTGRYRLSDRPAQQGAKTVIVDEASMLTEEMLAALFDALKGVDRLILIGDPRQLPPIGAGRPFVDIVRRLQPNNVHNLFPRVGPGYGELTIRRRQAGQVREDLQLAEWFSGAPLAPGEDEVFETVMKAGKSPHVRFVQWHSPEEVHEKLVAVLVDELSLSGPDDIAGSDNVLGATEVNGYRYFNQGAAEACEAWQILSPVRGMPYGVSEINRLVHRQFRHHFLALATQRYRKIPRPMGPEEIVYGDKVINVRNHGRDAIYPRDRGALRYIANGEIGIAIGQFKSAKIRSPWLLKVEFSSQQCYAYDFSSRDFQEEGEPILELAYALTIHKAQGSEFELVVLVLPNPCRLLSRELIYTALTRQRSRVVVLHQGDRTLLKRFASGAYSETASRLTNLFAKPSPVEIDKRFFEGNLIHRTIRGELVRSKSEVIIADRLADADVDYSHERELVINEVTKFPDFTIEDSETGRTFYWEHCGMLHVPEYHSRWEAKLSWYRANGILPYDEGGGAQGTLIVTRDSEQGAISSQDIERLIREVIL